MFKTILSIIIAVLTGLVLLKVVGWIFGAIFALTWFIFKVLIVGAIALPAFFFIKKKLLK